MVSSSQKSSVNWWVLIPSALSFLLLSSWILLFKDSAQTLLEKIPYFLSTNLGWYYLISVSIYLIFVLYLMMSRMGRVKLGRAEDEPEFSYLTWVGLLFSAGIGVPLIYFGSSEALNHFMAPPRGSLSDPNLQRQAMNIAFLHWGLHGWSIYALIGVTLGYFSYRRGLPLSLRSAVFPILGNKIHGPLGNVIDSFGLTVTLFALVSNLGIGALQVAAGLQHLLPYTMTGIALLSLMVIMTGCAIIASVSGVERGIQAIANVNMIAFIVLMIVVLVLGPTQFLVSAFFQNIGDYLSSIIGKSLDSYIYSSEAQESAWLAFWTIFYWGWWIAWGPFVGLFIARISKGRSIRQVILGVLFIPLGITLAWLSIFGNLSIHLYKEGNTLIGEYAQTNPAFTTYEALANFPFGGALALLALIVCFILFLTPADSGAVMLANLSVKEKKDSEAPTKQKQSSHGDAPSWLRVFWSVVVLLVTAALLLIQDGDISNIQMFIILSSLPFSIILFLYSFGLYKALREEIKPMRARYRLPDPPSYHE